MKTGCIQHPQNAPLLIVHQWQVDSLNGDVVAAKLMSFFEYWHSHKLDELLKSDKPDKRLLIQHHSEPELEAALFVGVARKTIRKAMKRLVNIGVIQPMRNPYIPQDRTRHLLFMPERAQELANQWNEIYQAHFEVFKGKRPICIPGNLSAAATGQFADSKRPDDRLPHPPSETAIGQRDDCNGPKDLLQKADLPLSKGQNAAFKRPNGLDPKTTSEITSETTDPPSPPRGNFVSPGLPKQFCQSRQPEAARRQFLRSRPPRNRITAIRRENPKVSGSRQTFRARGVSAPATPAQRQDQAGGGGLRAAAGAGPGV
jgi:hypothetical protein